MTVREEELSLVVWLPLSGELANNFQRLLDEGIAVFPKPTLVLRIRTNLLRGVDEVFRIEEVRFGIRIVFDTLAVLVNVLFRVRRSAQVDGF